MSHPLAQSLLALLGPDAGVGHAETAGTDGLFPDEAQAVERAIPKRQAEFAAGRRAARLALTGIGRPASSIPQGKDRAPEWPSGIVGSISHDKGHALAAVLPRDTCLGLGIDLTENAPLPGKTRREILPHPEEAGLDGIIARAGFSAKESLFKALYPSVGKYFGFKSACFIPDDSGTGFKITLTETLGPFRNGAQFQGRFAIHDDLILTSIRIDH